MAKIYQVKDPALAFDQGGAEEIASSYGELVPTHMKSVCYRLNFSSATMPDAPAFSSFTNLPYYTHDSGLFSADASTGVLTCLTPGRYLFALVGYHVLSDMYIAYDYGFQIAGSVSVNIILRARTNIDDLGTNASTTSVIDLAYNDTLTPYFAFAEGSGTASHVLLPRFVLLEETVPKYLADATSIPTLSRMGPPNYAQRETTNRMSITNRAWTVDRDGYVHIGFEIGNAADGVCACSIDGHREYLFLQTRGEYTPNVIPVHAGQYIELYFFSDLLNALECFYIPPVIVNSPAVVVTGLPNIQMQSGVTSAFPAIAQNSYASVHVNFPASYSTPPMVVLGDFLTAGSWIGYIAYAVSVTTTGFDCYVYQAGGNTITAGLTLRWCAWRMT